MFNPKFQITSNMLNRLAEVEVLRDKIRNCKIHPKEELILKRQAIISMVHNSTAIEGNPLNEYEVEQVLKGKRVYGSDRDINEVKNYKKALDFITKRKAGKITEKYVLKIHKLATSKILPKNRSGLYRKEPVYVVRRSLNTRQIIYTGPDHKEVPKLLRNLCKWINEKTAEKLSPVLIAGVAHAEIAAIHPFIDGNGRTARLLATLVLYNSAYDFRKLFALDNFYNKERPAYYKAIHLGKTYEERSQSDMTPWLEYFVVGFLIEMKIVFDKIKPFLYLKRKNKVILSQKELQILDFLQSMQSLTSSDVEDILSTTKRTSQRYLNKLIAKKLLKKIGSRKDAKYVST